MHTFKYAMTLHYPVRLNYEQIDEVFADYADRADQATKGNRSLWALHWTGNTLTVAFKRKRDWDQFAQVFQPHAPTGSAFVGTHQPGSKQPASTVKWSRRDFTSYCRLPFDSLDTERVGRLGAVVSIEADIVTGNDRSAYEVWFHNNKALVGFRHEADRDELVDVIKNGAGAEDEIIDEPPQVAASLHSISVH